MLELYHVSYSWYTGLACLVCVAVGAVVSLVRPADHRAMDRRLVSPAVPALFSCRWWPRVVREGVGRAWREIGAEVEDARVPGEMACLT